MIESNNHPCSLKLNDPLRSKITITTEIYAGKA